MNESEEFLKSVFLDIKDVYQSGVTTYYVPAKWQSMMETVAEHLRGLENAYDVEIDLQGKPKLTISWVPQPTSDE
ncbi:hypothetical protein BUW96_13615 [Achromobacter insolitus]|uniref:hypothetical protein n=1 Tax=Achromobacter insolitus TaxID=217204 RepID=UPI000972CF03|nr:hypothetical protein [Achromobacter insolitus]APX75804.1 hypothetical protein BUW96_13615 [Achromobacter insolitus]OWT56445.1 hypothetical protein CEY08_22325 [Achromobacter insolitus]